MNRVFVIFVLFFHACLIVQGTTLLHETFDSGQTVGAHPTGATRVRPTTNTSSNFVNIVSAVENSAGDGQGMQICDDDVQNPSALEYDVVGSAEPGKSHLKLSLDFSYVAGGGTSRISLSGGASGDALTSSSRRWFDFRFEADGDVAGIDVTDSLSHRLELYVNDSDTDQFEYTGPQGDATLQTNSISIYIDGAWVRDELLSSTVFGTTNNFGRIGFNTYTSATNVNYIFDNLSVEDLSGSSSLNMSWLVYSESDGLVYTPYANEGQNNAVNTVPDYSSAGFQGGGVAIPFIPSVVVISNELGDDSVLIQNAINAVSAMPMQANGFRGALLLLSGDYTVSNTLSISQSGVVIRGEGSQETGGTRIVYTADTQSDLFEVDSGSSSTQRESLAQPIVDSYVPVGVHSFSVADASVFSAGNRIIIKNLMNQQWIDDLNMGQWGWTPSAYQLEFRREITEIDGNTITLDAPIVQAVESQYGGGEIYTYSFPGELENIGFEGLRLESSYAAEDDEEHGWNAIEIRGLKNGWVRQVTGRYFGYSLVSLLSNSRKITVEDCAMLDPKSQTTGGRKYSFNIDDSDSVLMQRCFTRGGRHDFVSGSKTPGPNVFVDCRANNTFSDIGPHHRYATGQLYDNILGGQLHVQNREGSGSGHGWSGAQIMFWNSDAGSLICDAPKGAMNWCVGSVGNQNEGQWAPNEPFGIWDAHNSPVLPRSLYYAQLMDAVGLNRLQEIMIPVQSDAGVWTELATWAGDGLFGDELVLWESEPIQEESNAVFIRGMVRDLQILENGFSNVWQKISGPGDVFFDDAYSLETLVRFSEPGDYQLELSLAGGSYALSNTLIVTANETVSSLELYRLWLDDFSGLGTSTNLSDDAESDGMDNLLEYALNGNPLVNDAEDIMPVSDLVAAAGTNWLHYYISQRSDAQGRGLDYRVRSGAQLEGGLSNSVSPFSVSLLSNGMETATYRISTDEEDLGFLGLDVEMEE